MTGRAERKIAFITGAARGQRRSHAVRLAREGAGVTAVASRARAVMIGIGRSSLDELVPGDVVVPPGSTRRLGAAEAGPDSGNARPARTTA